MYRSKNRNRRNDVKGPNSALTQFLQEEGINAESIRQRWLDSHANENKDETQSNNDISETTETDDDLTLKNESVEIVTNSPNLLLSSDSNESSDDEKLGDSSSPRMRNAPQDSDEDEYDETVVSTRNHVRKVPDQESVLKKKARTRRILTNRRKKRKRAGDLLDKKEQDIPSLQQLCVSMISKNISTWQSEKNQNNPLYTHLRDVLGGISINNLNLLANAFSKNRALDDNTLQLFLKTDLKSLTFYDCSKVSYEGYKTLAIFSPQLEELSLQMCGQLNNEALLYISEKLPKLTSIKVDGPFLINEDTWIKFFENMKGRLKEFHISNTHRFTDKALSSLLENCHNELVSLRFSRLDSIFNYAILPQYLTNPEFDTLALEFPYNEEDITDEVIINILGQVGQSLKRFILKGCDELTDSMVVNGMNAFLRGNGNMDTNLEELELESLSQLTTDSLIYFFSQVSLPSLKKVSLMRCSEIGDEAVIELFLNSAKDSLVNLNLNSLKNLTSSCFEMLRCDKLETLDLSFVRCIDDKIIGVICDQNIRLKLIEVFGDNTISKHAKIRKGITLLGRQSDSI